MTDQTQSPGGLPTPDASRTLETGSAAQPHSRRSSGKWVWLLVLAMAGAAAYYYWPQLSASVGLTPAPAKQGGGGPGGRGPGVTPVLAEKAVRGQIGDYITGMGNVTPIYTTTIKSRVDGELMQVNYKEGDLVQKGASLVEIDPRPYQALLEQAQGALTRDQALLENAKVDVSRYADLLKQNAVPEQQYSTQKALVAQYEGIVKTDQGQIDSAQLNITYCHITAPISGQIGLRLVDPGNMVHASDANGLVVITQIQPISVIFPIAEDHLPDVLPQIRAGKTPPVEAWDRDQTKKLGEGVLSTIDNQIDQTTGTVRLRATFPNSDGGLFPNQLVYARLLIQEKGGVTLIPTAAIQRSAASTYVYLVKPDSTVTVREISIGISEGEQSEVLSGLAPGDQVVMTGVDKLSEGSRVNVQGSGPGRGAGGRQGRGGAPPPGRSGGSTQ